MAGNDVKSATATADGTMVNGRARLRHVLVKTSSTGTPQVIFKDGGSGGTTLLTMDFVVSVNEDIPLPDEGILFTSSIYVDVTNIDRVTILYA